MLVAFLLFLSTFGGVFSAFMLGLWGQSAQRRHVERIHRRESIESIRTEIEGIEEQCASHIDEWETSGRILVQSFSTDAKDSSVASGRFSTLDVILQHTISAFYSDINAAERELASVRDLGPQSRQRAEFYQSFLIDVRFGIPDLLVYLDEFIEPVPSVLVIMINDLMRE